MEINEIYAIGPAISVMMDGYVQKIEKTYLGGPVLFKYFFTLRIFSRFTVFIGCAIFSIILCPGHALTQTIEQKSTFNIYESSGFALRGQDNDLKLAPLLASKVDYEIDGILARASVTQQFVNNQSSWQEGIYVFPPKLSYRPLNRLKMMPQGVGTFSTIENSELLTQSF